MTLGAPLGLLLGALSAPLLALYFLKLRRRRVLVSSTSLWHAVLREQREATPFEKFRKNLLLLVQLLALALLTFALAQPAVTTPATTASALVLVLDTSASMGARDGSPARIDDARSAARAALDRLGAGDEAMLIVAGARTEVRVPFTRDTAALRAALAQASVGEAEGSLREGLQLALSMARSRSDVAVLVFSDGAGGEDLSDLSPGAARVELVPVGRASDNMGVVALDLRRSPANELDRQLFVTVENFGAKPQEAAVELFLGSELLGVRRAQVEAGASASLVWDVSGAARGLLRVELESPGDALAADDVAWAVLDPVSRRKVLLVGGDRLTARVLGADPRVQLSIVGAESFQRAQLDEVDCALFGGPVPSGLDGYDYAVLGPYPGGPLVFADPWPGPAVLGWRRTHPLMRFVEWGGVAIAEARTVSDANALVPLVEGDRGGLVWAGERNGGRVMQLAFDPLRSDLPLRVAWPVLLLNTVGWLTEGSGDGLAGEQIRAGHAWTRRVPDELTPEQVRVSGPDGQPVASQLSGGLVRVRDTHRLGVYTLQAGERQVRFASNLLSTKEGRLAPFYQLNLAPPSGEAGEVLQAGGSRPVWRPFAALGLIALLLEWFIWNRRRRG